MDPAVEIHRTPRHPVHDAADRVAKVLASRHLGKDDIEKLFSRILEHTLYAQCKVYIVHCTVQYTVDGA